MAERMSADGDRRGPGSGRRRPLNLVSLSGRWARAVADGSLALGALASRIVFHVHIFKAQWPDRRHLCDVLS
jgi:hypothetical protein